MINLIFYMSIFLIFLIWILFIWHYFIYFSCVNFFNIESKYIKKIIWLILFFLWVSYIIASIVARYFDNIITKFYYFSSGLWLWILINLFLMFILIWTIISMLKLTNIKFNIKFLASIWITFAFIISGYWVINAYYNIQVKNISVPIKNIPDKWKNKTAVQISDIHLWFINRKDFFERVIDSINKINPDIVFITWDLFDWMVHDMDGILDSLKKLHPKNWIYFVYWNHETYFWLDKVNELLKKYDLKILNNEIVNIEWIQIIWIWYPKRLEKFDIKNKILWIKNFDSNLPSILLFHSPTNIEENKSLWINLQLSGHTHVGQIFPLNYITKFVYKWYDYWLHTEWDYSIYTTNWVGTWWPTMRTFNYPEIVKINFK